MLRIHEIKLKPDEELCSIPDHIKKKLGMNRLEIGEWTLAKESVDARDKRDIRKVYSVDFKVCPGTGKTEEEAERDVLRMGERRRLKLAAAPDTSYHFVTEQLDDDTREILTTPPVVVGFGPCGMFAALLLAQMGYRPVVLERGKAIDERVKDVERFWRDGVLDPESNVQFGEGGAGSFSDGKLTTQIKDRRIRKVLEELTAAGGGEDLLYKQKPHVGTDVLREVVKNIRREILRLGGTVEFEACVTGLLFRNDSGGSSRALAGLKVRKNGNIESITSEAAVLALGHSARDTFRVLHEQGVALEQKPFSMGVRIEHPQKMINEAQYGKSYDQYDLGAADYKLSYRCKNGRGVYTFCMCPGGRVIASASQEGGVVTNGMSYRDRGLVNANSALLADVRTEDFGSSHPLAGIEFQERYERLAFEAGGRTYRAPAQRVGEFLTEGSRENESGNRNGIAAQKLECGATEQKSEECEAAQNPQECGAASVRLMAGEAAQKPADGVVVPTYEPGVAWTSLSACLPEFVTEALREALPELGKKLGGFDRPDAVLTALESRSSSPVRIPRQENGTCGIEGLYAGGEGAGYAGGITSAAVDGIRLAEAIALKYRPSQQADKETNSTK